MNSNDSNKKSNFFYGWVIVAVCMIIQAIPFGVSSNIPPAFTNFVVKGEGFTLASFSLIFTIGTIVSAVCSPFIGKLFSNPKVNVKLIYIVGSILLGGGFMLYSFAGGNLYAYYAIAAIVQVGTAIISAIGVPTLINAWFKHNKGLALGIAFSGAGIGNIVLQIIAGDWLNDPTIGYKGAYLRFGILALVVSLIVSIFFVRMPKSKAEIDAYVPKKNKTSEEAVKTSSHHWGYTLGEVTKMPSFWIIGIAFIFVGLYVSGMALQFIPYLQSLEESGDLLISSATIAAAFGFFSIFGNLLGGILFDKLGLAKSYLLAGILVIIAVLSLLFVHQINALGYLFSFGFGIAMFSYIMGPSYMTGTLFGDRDYGTILGVIQIFFALGFAVGTPIFGFIVDRLGWTTAWWATILYAILAYGGLIYACLSIIRINKENNVTETKRIS